MRDDTTDAARRARVEASIWGIAIVVLVAAHLAARGPALRLELLRAVLTLAAIGEALGSFAGAFRPRRFAEHNGRPYSPAYHGVSQDFAFYNFGFALLFALAALDPARAAGPIVIAIAIYAIHGTAHVCRYFGLYFGGGAPVPTRPQVFEMRDGLQLLAAATGMVLFLA